MYAHLTFDCSQPRDHIRLALFDMLRKSLWPQIWLLEFLADLAHLVGVDSRLLVSVLKRNGNAIF